MGWSGKGSFGGVVVVRTSLQGGGSVGVVDVDGGPLIFTASNQMSERFTRRVANRLSAVGFCRRGHLSQTVFPRLDSANELLLEPFN